MSERQRAAAEAASRVLQSKTLKSPGFVWRFE